MAISSGYNGSGSLQIALAVLCNFTKNNEFSLKYYINFKDDIISQLSQNDCVVRYSDIQYWVNLRKITN